MQKNYILLTDWAHKHGIDVNKAKDMARRGRLKSVVKKQMVKIERVVIPEDYKLAD